MSPPDQIPSVEQIRELARSGRSFVSWWITTFRSSGGRAHIEEETLVRALEPVVDAILPLEGIDEASIRGWGDEIWIALRDLPVELRATARTIGLEPLVAPLTQREAFKSERVLVWRNEIDEPFRNATMSIAKGFSAREFNKEILDWASEGKAAGYRSTMTPEEGKARFQEAFRVWHRSPRLGTIPFDEEKRRGLDIEVYPFANGIELLENSLSRMDCERRRGALSDNHARVIPNHISSQIQDATEIERTGEVLRAHDAGNSARPRVPPVRSKQHIDFAPSSRRRGQPLSDQEVKVYRKILKIAGSLKLPHRYPDKTRRIVNKCTEEGYPIDAETWERIRKWGLKHPL
jgi:hypothetical protein